MSSTVPGLFHRAILQSGTASTLNPIDLAIYDKVYRKLLGILGIPLEDSREQRLEKLRSVPVQELMDSYKVVGVSYPTFCAVDGWFWREPINAQNCGEVIAKCEWVNEVMLGDCLQEVVFLI